MSGSEQRSTGREGDPLLPRIVDKDEGPSPVHRLGDSGGDRGTVGRSLGFRHHSTEISAHARLVLTLLAALAALVAVIWQFPVANEPGNVQQSIYLPMNNYLPMMLTEDGNEESDATLISPPPSAYTEEALMDRITYLPGLDYDPAFNMFSGYLTVSEENGRNIFYWFVESQGDPATDPVVLWTNGGPGCSGLIGFGQEHGPFHISRDGALRPAPYSWNSVASMLYVEIPAGVGFSYSETPGDLQDVSDEDAAADNLVLIQKFLDRFPQRRANDFYIASESYGGHYIPQLAKKIVDEVNGGANDINFRGFLVGNPWVDPFTNAIAQTRDFYQHGLISRPMLEHWLSKCSVREDYDHEKCPRAIQKMRQNMKDISPYALDYPKCTEEKVDYSNPASSQVMTFLNHTARKHLFPQNLGPLFLPPDIKYLPCEEQHFQLYLNQEEVQKALHVRPTFAGKRRSKSKRDDHDDVDETKGRKLGSKSKGGDDTNESSAQRWRACASSSELSYSTPDFLASQISLYKELVDIAKSGNLHLKMLIFSGDNDSVCSTSSTQAWIYDLGVKPFPNKDWIEWTVNRQTAGFVTHFDLGEQTQSNFIFATVHGAGHEVPAYRPIEGLSLFRNFLNDEL